MFIYPYTIGTLAIHFSLTRAVLMYFIINHIIIINTTYFTLKSGFFLKDYRDMVAVVREILNLSKSPCKNVKTNKSWTIFAINLSDKLSPWVTDYKHLGTTTNSCITLVILKSVLDLRTGDLRKESTGIQWKS